MARMYPPQIFSGTKSPGEKVIFEQIKNDPIARDWIVLHSLDIANHVRQITGEADFVIGIPHKGVLVLEVKACKSIRRDGGLWYLGVKPPEKRGPFKQASEAMQSIKSMLWKSDESLKTIVVWSAVVFPYVDFEIESPEWHKWQCIDNQKLSKKPLGKLILDVLDNARSHLRVTSSALWFDPNNLEPNKIQLERILEILRPDFEFYQSPQARAKRRINELKKYTQEQFDALDAMEQNNRVIFSGPAGTGKTILAIEMVRRAYLENKKILFLCFNRLLCDWLQKETKEFYPQVVTNTIHSYMLSVASISPENNNNFWSNDLPQIAREKITAQKCSNDIFDAIIVDESQDLLHYPYLEFLDVSLKGGINNGNIYFFGDFEKQAIYQSNPKNIFETALSDIPIYSLRVNCRNTPRIAEFVHLLGCMNPQYSRIRRPDNLINPEVYVYGDDSFQKNKLRDILLTLLEKEDYLGDEIIILSPLSNTKCISNQLTNFDDFKLKPIYARTSKDQIPFCTVHSYKGLEAPVVIMTDINDFDSDRAKSLFYVAATRALEKLILLINASVRDLILEILSSKSS